MSSESITGGAVDVCAADHGTCLTDCIHRLVFLRAEFHAQCVIFEHAATETREIVRSSSHEQLRRFAARSADVERIAELVAELGELARLIPSCARLDIVEHSIALCSVARQIATEFLLRQQSDCQDSAAAVSALLLVVETASLAERFALVLEKLARWDRARQLVASAVKHAECMAQQAMAAVWLLGPHARSPAWFVLVALGVTHWPQSAPQVRATCRFVLVLVSSAARRFVALAWVIAEFVSRLRGRSAESGRSRRDVENPARSSLIEKKGKSAMSYSPGDWVELVRAVDDVSAGQRGKVTSTGFLGELDIELTNGDRLTSVDASAVKSARPTPNSSDGGCVAALVCLVAGAAAVFAAVATAWARARWGA